MKFRFAGLVSHVTLEPGNPKEETQLAILPYAVDHVATLSVRDDLVDDPEDVGKVVDGTRCFPLARCFMSPDLGSGAVAIRQIEDVPSLKNVTNGAKLTAEVEKCPPDAAVFSAIVYLPPRGRLFAEDYFKYEVEFNGKFHGPLPRTITYTIRTISRVGFEIYNKDTDKMAPITFEPDAEVLVANVCESTTGNHFQNYKLLFDPPASSVYDPSDTKKKPCTFYTPAQPLPKCATEADLEVDCSNSRFP